MKLFSSLEAASDGSLAGSAICLGNFDGVHLGHQALFQAARAHGSAVALTFEPHPGKVLQPALAPRLIVAQARKLELLEGQVGATIVQPFSLEYAATSAEAFERSLLDGVRVKHVVVGSDFTYGAKRVGTIASLEAAAAKRGAAVTVVAPVTVDGVVVSSSKIREYTLEGRVEAAARLLGRPFDLDGVVVAGAGRGRTIGFPTANVETTNELRPGAGVYAVRARVPNGRWLGGAANIGVKPTFGGGEVTIEAHLFDFSGDLYGQRLRLQFFERLRGEHRFASVTELTEQIARDLEAARAAVARSSG
jgi:riboflavin kinase / FMN adenylyltransferase